MTDEQLVRHSRGGDQDAYRNLVGRYQGHVYGLAYSLVGDWAEAQDIAQETFIRAYVNLGQLRDGRRFPAWLRRVAFSVAMNWLKAFRPGLFEQLDGKVDLEHLEMPDFRPGPSELAQKRELADAVLDAVASLPPKYRLPITMFHLDGLSYKKVADFLDIPLGTVKSIIHRARAKLRAALPPAIAAGVVPTVQEVFNEHRLGRDFGREVWGLCMDWLSAVEGAPSNPETQQAMALAAARDPDVAAVNEWRRQAEPIPQWALEVDRETPRWGIEIWHYRWIEQLERSVWMIGHETSLPGPAPAACGSVGAARRQWASTVDDALGRWLAGRAAEPGEPALVSQIHSLLAPADDDKAAAVQLLRDTLGLACDRGGEDFEAAFDKLKTPSQLAADIRAAMKYLQYQYSYRWEKNVLALCRIIGEGRCPTGRELIQRVREYGDELGCAHDDDSLRVSTSRAMLLGLWAWLNDVPGDGIASAYPAAARVAGRVRDQLGEMTPVKRWLAGRLFVGIRIWTQQMGDKLRFWHRSDAEPIERVLTTNSYPTLA